MRTGDINRAGAQYCLPRSLGNLSDEERREFEQTALYIMVPTWKRTIPITKQHLKDLKQPVARIDCQYTYNEGRQNHAGKECNNRHRSGIQKSSWAEVDWKPTSICSGGFPRQSNSPSEAWNPANPTRISIPITTTRCEKKCCSQKAVPLRVCKAITIHKSQGQTVVGPAQTWKRVVVVGIPARSGRTTPSLEQAAFSRVESKEAFAVADDIPLDIEMFLKIGQGKAYDLSLPVAPTT
jgi:hypothetical protein